MTNKDIINTLNLILNEMNSFKTEVKEEFKKVYSKFDEMETFVKEEFENHVKKYHS